MEEGEEKEGKEKEGIMWFDGSCRVVEFVI